MIQDIFPKIYHNEYSEKRPGPDSFILQFRENKIFAKIEDNRIAYPGYPMFESGCSYIYLFAIDDREYFLADTQEEMHIDGFEYHEISVFRTALPKHRSFAGITAYQLYGWYRDNKYCGRCGSQLKPDHKERMLFCSACHNTVYPRISPAVIVGITNGDYLLLTKYAGSGYQKYALVAGFTEIGENAEKTVEREVMEEVGLKVKNIKYYRSQPWPFTGTLLMGFFAELDGDATVTLDTKELSEAKWVHRDEIPVEGHEISLTREMMYYFASANSKKVPL